MLTLPSGHFAKLVKVWAVTEVENVVVSVRCFFGDGYSSDFVFFIFIIFNVFALLISLSIPFLFFLCFWLEYSELFECLTDHHLCNGL